MTIIIDNGSSSCKSGFSDSEEPRSIVPSVVGFPSNKEYKGLTKDEYICDEALEKSSLLNLEYPIKNGIIQNFDQMIKIWDFIIKRDLRIDPSEHSVILSEVPSNPKAHRQKITQIIFETFNFKSFYLEKKETLSLYSTSKSTGIVFNTGEEASHIVPIYECISINHGINRLMIAGRDLNQYLSDMLSRHNFDYIDKKSIRYIKENYTHVAVDYDSELKNLPKDDAYEMLPNGKYVKIGKESIDCPELYFNPQLNNLDVDSVHKAIHQSIKSCNADVHADLFANIVVSGGSSMFNGFPERIQKEVAQLAPNNMKVKVNTISERKFGAFIGAVNLASFPSFPQMVIKYQEYQEEGPNIVSVMCI